MRFVEKQTTDIQFLQSDINENIFDVVSESERNDKRYSSKMHDWEITCGSQHSHNLRLKYSWFKQNILDWSHDEDLSNKHDNRTIQVESNFRHFSWSEREDHDKFEYEKFNSFYG